MTYQKMCAFVVITCIRESQFLLLVSLMFSNLMYGFSTSADYISVSERCIYLETTKPSPTPPVVLLSCRVSTTKDSDFIHQNLLPMYWEYSLGQRLQFFIMYCPSFTYIFYLTLLIFI